MRCGVIAALVMVVGRALAQAGPAPSAALSGRVLAEGTLAPIARAEISIPVLDVVEVSNEHGAFAFKRIPKGKHFLEVRALGRSPLRMILEIGDTGRVVRDFVLKAVASLDTVNVVASAVVPSFEEHRATGLGQFFTRADLEKQKGRKLGDILSQTRGVRVLRGNANAAWLTSSRGPRSIGGSGRNVDQAEYRKGARNGECYAQVYLDAMLIYKSSRIANDELFDLNTVAAEQIEAIEYYSGPASTPLMYSRLNTECGVLVIHTRRFSADSSKKKP